MHSRGFADGKSTVGIEFGDGVSPQCTLISGEWGWLKRHYGVWAGGMVGLLVESALEEAIGDCGLAGASMLASPEAVELGGLDCIAGHWKLEEIRTREICGWECGSESEDLSSPF